MIRITSKRDGFWRAGVQHSSTPREYPDDAFTDRELALLRAEPMLTVERIGEGRTGEDNDRVQALVRAVAALDPEDKALWTGSGTPRTEALEKIVGGRVTAEERDQAWQVFREND